jgi:hypothetical protein
MLEDGLRPCPEAIRCRPFPAGHFRGLVLGAPIPVEGRVGGEITSFREGSRPRYSGPQVTDSPGQSGDR